MLNESCQHRLRGADIGFCATGTHCEAPPGFAEPVIGRRFARTSHQNSGVIPGCATWRRPGIHTPGRGYGFRARATRAPE
jgi:hypothetical protein